MIAALSGEPIDHNGEQVQLVFEKILDMDFASGAVLTGDPGYAEYFYPLKRLIPTGTYPVWAGMLGEKIALVKLQLTDELPVTFEPAIFDTLDGQGIVVPKPNEYGVDGGQGCFLDMATWTQISEMAGKLSEIEFFQAMDDVLFEPLYEIYGTSTVLGSEFSIFRTGAGDGTYESFWALDANGEPCALLTDFRLLYLLTPAIVEEFNIPSAKKKNPIKSQPSAKELQAAADADLQKFQRWYLEFYRNLPEPQRKFLYPLLYTKSQDYLTQQYNISYPDVQRSRVNNHKAVYSGISLSEYRGWQRLCEFDWQGNAKFKNYCEQYKEAFEQAEIINDWPEDVTLYVVGEKQSHWFNAGFSFTLACSNLTKIQVEAFGDLRIQFLPIHNVINKYTQENYGLYWLLHFHSPIDAEDVFNHSSMSMCLRYEDVKDHHVMTVKYRSWVLRYRAYANDYKRQPTVRVSEDFFDYLVEYCNGHELAKGLKSYAYEGSLDPLDFIKRLQ